MVITSHRSDTPKIAPAFARFCSQFRLFALLPALMPLVVPATAWGDIYKWTDEQGRINISNVPPPTSGKAKDVELVLKEAKPASIPQHLATPTEQALLARIESLERQLQARQYATPAPAVAPPTPYGDYYPPQPQPPPPSASYYGSGYSSGYPGYYPSYYPGYTYPVASSYVVYPARAYYPQPVYMAPRVGFSHAGGGGHSGHRGRR